ncbi:tail fiber domain-containing protein, partial [Escherichia coli]|nr:tail fiber domain-containing protein [Escherichia coli]EIG1367542.1 tail fiber domain-containing protein [Escherichia coli]EJK2757679.1 tail fiber domain-containing protein [Escherichia coli]ELF2540658.1 tail fiber domain-containing protein [Escherichia coli]
REKSDPLTTSELSLNMSPGYEGDAILDAWGDIRIVAFRWLAAVREKGDGARWHFGVIAQQVRDTFLAHGVDGTRFGLLCYDEWDDQYEPVMAVRTITEVVDGVEIEREEEYETEERTLVRKAGNRWGIRADQCLWLESAYLRRRIEKIESHLAELNNLLNPEGGSK